MKLQYRVTQKNLQNLLLPPIRDVPPSVASYSSGQPAAGTVGIKSTGGSANSCVTLYTSAKVSSIPDTVRRRHHEPVRDQGAPAVSEEFSVGRVIDMIPDSDI